ncbi:zinc metalloprotease HtpX [Solemya pervernicosa gill symbiont]|uniref:Protease HtpX n=2 Tax=Gammaproteobacteria incertae sedis TaxID=118884 RepID=A0A1T2L6H4_9GAMM|nr:protease HtpX [Candidatus Reidiella endopervernicosa]OOZ40650.1 zinc metalloprotease HtpX [Solemya pervernicosa gill symbiont]QKQ27406.1 protease HtpX [Candidatus Reidiella endopervernicosa]
MFSRIALFLLANFGVLAVLSISMRVLGVDRMLASGGGFNLTGLLIMASVMGFAGSFISLAISKWMAKRSMGVQLITTPSTSTETWLVDTVRRQAQQAGIGMPEVGVFNSPQPNAFATGMNRNNALVAVSTGLLQQMQRGEVEAVLGHEVSHVANGDMVTMGLLQGVLNTFVIFFSRVIGILIDRAIFKIERGVGPGYWIGSILAEMVLGILAAMVAMWFSRYREFHADSGGARLSSRQNMIAALEALKRVSQPKDLPGEMAAFGISGGIGHGLAKLLRSHPPLDQRIAALRAAG